ncbi:uncharacterized protein LOC119725586 [Patiria miniata]|uniref:DUF4252 domain-containing protein n=1 Tax=Patiria miniata TaxID=46514 RepID=A0A913ZME9_PATMI|nr:uncharacterized protein LOC119725586 [Patiria miniata]
MVGLKCVFLVSLVASALVVGNAESDTLDSLLRRVLNQMHARAVQDAQEYVQRLMTAASASDGTSSIERLSVLDMTSGKLLASGGQGAVPLSDDDKAKIAGAVKNGRYQMFESAGLKVDSKTYRLFMSTASQAVVRFGNRSGTILVKKTGVGALIVRVPAGKLNQATIKALADTSK